MIFKFLLWTGDEVLNKIKSFTNYVETIPIFSNSPDSKDNFLFDLA